MVGENALHIVMILEGLENTNDLLADGHVGDFHRAVRGVADGRSRELHTLLVELGPKPVPAES